MGMIRGPGFSVMRLLQEAVSAGSLRLSKGLLPSVLEVGVAICGLDVKGFLSEEDWEMDEDEGIALEGIWGRLEAPDPFSLPPPLELLKLSFSIVVDVSGNILWVLDLLRALDDSPPGFGGREARFIGLGGREANPVFAD